MPSDIIVHYPHILIMCVFSPYNIILTIIVKSQTSLQNKIKCIQPTAENDTLIIHDVKKLNFNNYVLTYGVIKSYLLGWKIVCSCFYCIYFSKVYVSSLSFCSRCACAGLCNFLVLFISLNLFNLIYEGVEQFSSYGNACDLYFGMCSVEISAMTYDCRVLSARVEWPIYYLIIRTTDHVCDLCRCWWYTR